MNSGRSKLIVGSSGGKMIVNSVVCFLDLFGELPVPLHATGVLETLNFCSF